MRPSQESSSTVGRVSRRETDSRTQSCLRLRQPLSGGLQYPASSWLHKIEHHPVLVWQFPQLYACSRYKNPLHSTSTSFLQKFDLIIYQMIVFIQLLWLRTRSFLCRHHDQISSTKGCAIKRMVVIPSRKCHENKEYSFS
jgi:hypothetical protein